MSFDAIRHKKKALFLNAFSECGRVDIAAERAEIDRTTHYVWLKEADYADAFKEALSRAARGLEDEAVKRAYSGSDTLLIFLLKCRNRPVFGDRASFEHTGPDGKPLMDLAMARALLHDQ